jgi:hypothetical protein
MSVAAAEDCPLLEAPIELKAKDPYRDNVVLTNIHYQKSFKPCSDCKLSDDLVIELFPIIGSTDKAVGIRLKDNKASESFGFDGENVKAYQQLKSELLKVTDGTDYRMTTETRWIQNGNKKVPYTLAAGFQMKDQKIVRLGLTLPDKNDIKNKKNPGHRTFCLASADLK